MLLQCCCHADNWWQLWQIWLWKSCFDLKHEDSTDEIENDWDYEPHPMTEWMMVTLVNEASNKYDHEAFFYDFTMTLATKVVIEDITI